MHVLKSAGLKSALLVCTVKGNTKDRKYLKFRSCFHQENEDVNWIYHVQTAGESSFHVASYKKISLRTERREDIGNVLSFP